MPVSSGWKFNALWDFRPSDDGNYPVSDVLVEPSGELFGTTSSGGVPPGSYEGIVFRVTP
ncbi:MAG TPA: hypothetical protein VGI19_11100 [Candidatus Cybelea sp.]